MSNAHLYAAASNLADAIDGIDDASLWGDLTCLEADSFADLLMAVGREGTAASLILRHSHADTAENEDRHAEIGAAARAQANVRNIAWAERYGYRLAVEYVRELS